MSLSLSRQFLILSLAGLFGLSVLAAQTQASPGFECSTIVYRSSCFGPFRPRPHCNPWGLYGYPYSYGYYGGAYPWGYYRRPYGWGWGGYPHRWSWRGQHHSFGPRYFGHRSFGRRR